MVTDCNQTYHGDHFIMYINVRSLFYTPETNIILYVSHTSKKLKSVKIFLNSSKRKKSKASSPIDLASLVLGRVKERMKGEGQEKGGKREWIGSH